MTTGVVMNVKSRASKTNIEKTVGERMFAFSPTLRTINSTSLETG